MHSGKARTRPGRSPRPGRILAIDFGVKRMGLALADELGISIAPLAVLKRKNRREDMKRLREIVREKEVAQIVVGVPVRLDGTSGEMVARVTQFARRIEKELAVPVTLEDERLSSWEAEQTMAETRGGRKENQNVDAVAAAVILRSFLERERKPKTK